MAVFYPTIPQIRPNSSSAASFSRPRPNQSFNPTMQNILNRVGGMLTNQGALTDKLKLEDFAVPQRGVFQEFVNQSLRPEFERFQMNPFERQYANASAASNRMYAGNAPARYQDTRRQVEMPFFDQVEQMKAQSEGLISDAYRRRLKSMGESATAFNNIGATNTMGKAI